MRRNRELVLGALVFVAVTSLVVGTMWLSENYWGPAGGYKIVTTFDSVMGLNRGGPATIRGVRVGKVLAIYMERGRPMVLLGFDRVDRLPRDSRFILRSEGLLGERQVEVQVGSSDVNFSDGDLVIGESSPGLDNLTEDGAKISTRIRAVIDSVASDENIARLSATIANVDSTSIALKRFLVLSQSDLSSTATNLASASKDAAGIVGESRERLRRSLDRLEETTGGLSKSSKNLDMATKHLSQTMSNLSDITSKINSGQGTLGRLINDPGVYSGLESTLTSVDSLLEAVKMDPGRYLNFKFTIF